MVHGAPHGQPRRRHRLRRRPPQIPPGMHPCRKQGPFRQPALPAQPATGRDWPKMAEACGAALGLSLPLRGPACSRQICGRSERRPRFTLRAGVLRSRLPLRDGPGAAARPRRRRRRRAPLFRGRGDPRHHHLHLIHHQRLLLSHLYPRRRRRTRPRLRSRGSLPVGRVPRLRRAAAGLHAEAAPPSVLQALGAALGADAAAGASTPLPSGDHAPTYIITWAQPSRCC